MAIRIVRLGSPREEGEGLRIGTVRRPPRGVPKKEHASRNFYDVWFPNLSPSEALLKEGLSADDEKTWSVFKRKFLAEMKAPGAGKDLDLLAALSHQTNLSVGCYCRNERGVQTYLRFSRRLISWRFGNYLKSFNSGTWQIQPNIPKAFVHDFIPQTDDRFSANLLHKIYYIR